MWKIKTERTPIRKTKNFDVLSKVYRKHFMEFLERRGKGVYNKKNSIFGILGENNKEVVLTLYEGDSKTTSNIRASVNRRNIRALSKLLNAPTDDIYNELISIVIR